MDKANKYAFEQVKTNYNMPFLEIGMNVLVNRKACTVTGVSNSGLKGKLLNFDKSEINFHPTWETAYCDKDWNVKHDYRSKSNQDYETGIPQ